MLKGTNQRDIGGRREIDALVRQFGFTLVETVVAVLILMLAALATFALFDVGTRTTLRAEGRQSMLNVAQRELEELRDLDYGKLALTVAPSTESDETSPASRIDGSSFELSDGSSAELVVNGSDGVAGGTVIPGPEPFQHGDINGTIYRFIVWRNDPGCIAIICPGSKDYKRAVVAVRLEPSPATGGEPVYEELSSDFSDPARTAADTDVPGAAGEIVTAQQFYLSDTRCVSGSGDPARQTPTSHTTHDTTGTCGTQQTANGPDALIAGAAPEDPVNPPLRDYATELEPTSDPACATPSENCSSLDAGLQLVRPAADGCDPSPTGPDRHQIVHRWLTQPVPTAFAMTGKATLELYTRTIDDVAAAGKICVYLFTRSLDLLGTPLDTPIVDADNPTHPYFTRAESPWPAGEWRPLRIVMSFPAATLVAGQRLGLAISIERAGTAPDVLQFAYDHLDYDSRVEVLTTTPLG